GPAIIQMQYGWPHLYDTACRDVSDVVQILKGKLGTVNSVNDAFCKVGGKYLAVPYCQAPNAWTYRTDLWQQAGLTGFFKTWDELAAAGRQLKNNGLNPIAVSLGHAYGDALTMWYPVLWDHGGRGVSPGCQPRGPQGISTLNLIFNHAVMKWTQEEETAKAFILYLMDPTNYAKWLNASVGYNAGPFKALANAQIYQTDTKLKPFHDVVGT